MQLSASTDNPRFRLAMLKLVILLKQQRHAEFEATLSGLMTSMDVEPEAFRRYLAQNMQPFVRSFVPREG